MLPGANQIKISPMSGKEHERFAGARAFVEGFLGDDEENKKKYKTAIGKVSLLRAILQGKGYTADDPVELQCLGVVFGDALAQELNLEWVMYEDEMGKELALGKVDAEEELNLFPLDMILTRVEDEEDFDVVDLFKSTLSDFKAMRGDA